MTGLTRYQRLEGTGLWRPDAQAQRREVAVRLRPTSLVLADATNGTALAHWALTAVARANPGRMPALFRPGPDADGESLETDDATLIEAIETVRAALNPPPRGRWLRWGALAAGVGVLALGIVLLPAALTQRAAAIMPPAVRAEVGREALDRLIQTHPDLRLCAEPAGRQVLTALRNRVLGAEWRVQVLDGLPGFQAGHLPGRIALIGRDLLERLDAPEALAGWLLAQELAHDARDPMLDVLRHAGVRATLAMLTTGTLSEGALAGYALGRLAQPIAWPDAGAVATRMTALNVPFAPFAASLPPEAARLAAVLAAGPEQGDALLTDGEWLTLQAVCLG